MIEDVAFTAYPTNDVASLRAWYEEKLGLAFAGPWEWVGREPGSGAGVVFEVDDVETAARALRDKGVSVEEVFEGAVCKQISFNELEGNKGTLHQNKAP